MDKSFNDQELSDIMKEIEALEVDFKEEEEAQVEDHERASPVLHELSDLPEGKAIPLKAAKEDSFVPKSPAALSFKVHGDLNLELEFEIGGKFVSLQVAEDGLTIVLDGGMTFKVPVGDKKAA